MLSDSTSPSSAPARGTSIGDSDSRAGAASLGRVSPSARPDGACDDDDDDDDEELCGASSVGQRRPRCGGEASGELSSEEEGEEEGDSDDAGDHGERGEDGAPLGDGTEGSSSAASDNAPRISCSHATGSSSFEPTFSCGSSRSLPMSASSSLLEQTSTAAPRPAARAARSGSATSAMNTARSMRKVKEEPRLSQPLCPTPGSSTPILFASCESDSRQ